MEIIIKFFYLHLLYSGREICCIKKKTQNMTNREKCAYEDGSAKRKYLSFNIWWKNIKYDFKKDDANLSSSRLLCQHRGRSHPASLDRKLPLKYHILLFERFIFTLQISLRSRKFGRKTRKGRHQKLSFPSGRFFKKTGKSW